MTVLATISASFTVLADLARVLIDPRFQKSILNYIHAFRRPRQSYENLLLQFDLDISRRDGTRGELRREQRVRFLTSEAGVIRELAWGDGKQMTGYRSHGATPVEHRREGMCRVVWLGLPERPVAGQVATIHSRRTVVDALTRSDEFLEAVVERPTRRLRMRVTFPADRPPIRVAAVSATHDGEQPRRLTLHPASRGRLWASWTQTNPRPGTTYRIAWSW